MSTKPEIRSRRINTDGKPSEAEDGMTGKQRETLKRRQTPFFSKRTARWWILGVFIVLTVAWLLIRGKKTFNTSSGGTVGSGSWPESGSMVCIGG